MGHRIQQWVMLGYRMSEGEFKSLPKVSAQEDPFEYVEEFNCSHKGQGKMNIQLCFTERAGEDDVIIGRCLLKSDYAEYITDNVSISLEKAMELKPFIDGLLEAIFDHDFSKKEYGFHFVGDLF